MASDLKTRIAAIPQAKPYGLSTTVPAPELPEHAGVLSPMLQSIARNYLGARARAGEAILDSARYLAEARAAAQYGEWKVFLEATGTTEDTAARMLSIASRAKDDQQYARAISDGRLAFTAAFELLNAPEATQRKVLESTEPTPASAIRADKQAEKLRTSAEFLSGEPFWQSIDAHHPSAHLWTRERPDLWRSACGLVTQNRAPQGSTEGGHCSSCTRATWTQTQPEQKPSSPEVAPTPAPDLLDLGAMLLRLSAHGYDRISTRQKGMTTFYTFRDRASDLDEDSAGVIEMAEGQLPYWLGDLDRTAKYKQAQREKQKQETAPVSTGNVPPGIALSIDLQRRLVAAGAGIGSDGTVYAPGGSGEPPTILSSDEAEQAIVRWAARQAEAPQPSEDPQRISQGAKRRAIALIKELEPLMKLIKTEDIEGLAGAMSELNECEEGSEGEYWISVGYALCDVEP